MLDLAKRMSRAKPSAIMAVAEKAKQLEAQGREVISFSIGVPNFLPGQHVYDVGRDPLRRVPMMEPLRGTADHVARLLDECDTAAELLNRLGS